ncbi:hypothetical protein FKM82_017378 [Ascaphus truei]
MQEFGNKEIGETRFSLGARGWPLRERRPWPMVLVTGDGRQTRIAHRLAARVHQCYNAKVLSGQGNPLFQRRNQDTASLY